MYMFRKTKRYNKRTKKTKHANRNTRKMKGGAPTKEEIAAGDVVFEEKKKKLGTYQRASVTLTNDSMPVVYRVEVLGPGSSNGGGVSILFPDWNTSTKEKYPAAFSNRSIHSVMPGSFVINKPSFYAPKGRIILQSARNKAEQTQRTVIEFWTSLTEVDQSKFDSIKFDPADDLASTSEPASTHEPAPQFLDSDKGFEAFYSEEKEEFGDSNPSLSANEISIATEYAQRKNSPSIASESAQGKHSPSIVSRAFSQARSLFSRPSADPQPKKTSTSYLPTFISKPSSAPSPTLSSAPSSSPSSDIYDFDDYSKEPEKKLEGSSWVREPGRGWRGGGANKKQRRTKKVKGSKR